jgi:hypothetical protein
MAKLKVSGSASGTGTITLIAPATSTDRTITLPDESITLGGGVDGIVSTANATAITIDSLEQVGIGVSPSDHTLSIKSVDNTANVLELASGDSQTKLNFSRSGNPTAYIRMYEDGASGTGALYFGVGTSHTPIDTLKITSDGRGLSQFTAKAWCRFTSSLISDSHNVSSLTDNGTGDWTINWDIDLSNGDYAMGGMAHAYMHLGFGASPSVGSVRVKAYNTSGSQEDGDWMSVIAFGD